VKKNISTFVLSNITEIKLNYHKSSEMTNKKWAVKRITVNLAVQEAEKLEQYCQETGRPATDVIRELIRGLPIAGEIAKASH
jgi:hypothetical protein